MIRFFKKDLHLLAVADGRLIPLEQVADEAFSSGVLGQGYAVEPTAGNIYAPIDGTVESIADSKHAYTLLTDDGMDLLIHVGIDTVELHGEGFSPAVKEGDRVRAGDLLLQVDLPFLRSRGYSVTVPVVITNPEALKHLRLLPTQDVLGGKSNAAEYQIQS